MPRNNAPVLTDVGRKSVGILWVREELENDSAIRFLVAADYGQSKLVKRVQQAPLRPFDAIPKNTVLLFAEIGNDLV